MLDNIVSFCHVSPQGGARPIFSILMTYFFLSSHFFSGFFGRFVENAVFGSGVLVGATAQIFAGSPGREQFFVSYTLCAGRSHIFVYRSHVYRRQQ